MSPNLRLSTPGLLLALCSGPALAEIPIDSYASISGYGTLGMVHSNYEEADFIGIPYQPRGAGYSRKWSAMPDTDFGVQLDLKITQELSAVVQGITRENADGNYKPSLEWANIKYTFNPDVSVSLGRAVLPTFERSDSQNVGYSLPWVRVPTEIEYASPASHVDGIDVNYQMRTGAVAQTIQALWGGSSQSYFGATYRFDRLLCLVDTVRLGNASVHLAYESMNVNFAGVPKDQYWVADLGFTYDPGRWFVTGDSNVSKDEVFGKSIGWYVSGGVRLGNFTPYAVYSQLRSIPPEGQPLVGDQRTVAGGVRWDFAKNLDLKFQLQRVTEKSTTPASFTNVQPGAQIGDSPTVASVALDFLF
jgi:Gram-negative porin